MDGKKVFSAINNSVLTFLILLGVGLAVIVFITSGKSPIGGKKDKHGCIPSAGYTWSQARNECVRVFEVSTQLLKTGSNNPNDFRAFIVFNDNKTLGDIYLPGPINLHIALDKETKKQGYSKWIEKNNEYTLILKGNKLALFKDNTEIYFRMFHTEPSKDNFTSSEFK